MKNEKLNIDEKTKYIQSRQYSFKDMLKAWHAGRHNLAEWGDGDGDMPDFMSWMREFNKTNV